MTFNFIQTNLTNNRMSGDSLTRRTLASFIKRGVKLKNWWQGERLPAIELQEKELRTLLKGANNSAFGNHFQFKRILQSPNVIEAFQKSVPIYDYDKMYTDWWHRTLNQEADVAWNGTIKYFALSSGTSGAPSKYIPVTNDMIKAMRKAGVRMFEGLVNHDVDDSIYGRGMMMLGGCTDLIDKGGYYLGDLSGINASKLPFWLRPFYLPGKKISRLQDWETRLNEIAKEAPNWDIGFIMGIPAWVQLMIERIIEYNNVESIHDIWPNLQVYVTGGVAFEPYRKGFDNLTSKPLHFFDTYLASEGFFAIQTRAETRAMALLTDNSIFFEFIPFNEKNFTPDGVLRENVEVLTIDKVEENIDYAMLVTTCAGAWRYLVGDTVKFTDKSRDEIIITGRTKHFLSLCGEHLSVDNMNNAIELVEKELNVSIREYTVSGIRCEGSFAHKWYVGCEPLVDENQLKRVLDEKLKLLNEDYETERSVVLKDPQVSVIPTSMFYDWQKSKGKLGGQNKFPRVMKAERFADWEQFIRARMISQ